MLTQAQVEAEMERLLAAAEEVAHDVAARADEAARAEHDYRLAFAKALIRAEGSVAVREAHALVVCEAEHLARKVAEARLAAAQETARMIRARLDALRSVNATVRHAVGGDW